MWMQPSNRHAIDISLIIRTTFEVLTQIVCHNRKMNFSKNCWKSKKQNTKKPLAFLPQELIVALFICLKAISEYLGQYFSTNRLKSQIWTSEYLHSNMSPCLWCKTSPAVRQQSETVIWSSTFGGAVNGQVPLSHLSVQDPLQPATPLGASLPMCWEQTGEVVWFIPTHHASHLWAHDFMQEQTPDGIQEALEACTSTALMPLSWTDCYLEQQKLSVPLSLDTEMNEWTLTK